MDYKYNCSSLHYLKMESGLITVPDDSKDTYIVVQPEEGDLGVADNVIYQYTNGQWVDTGDTLERGFEDELRQNI